MQKWSAWTDFRLEEIIGRLLRAGVVLAAVVVFAGAIIYLLHHGMEHPEYHTFHGEEASLKSIGGIVHEALALHGRGIIQFGLLLLVLTPISRVAFSAIGFLLEGDRMYVVMTLIVLAVLLFSLFRAT
jgi:uncharacterized membrane protein